MPGITAESFDTSIILDTGAQVSVTGDKNILDDDELGKVDFQNVTSVTKDQLNIEGVGYITLGLMDGDKKKVVSIPMLYCPNISGTYISERDLIRYNVDYRSIGGKPNLVWQDGNARLYRVEGLPMIPKYFILKYQDGCGVSGIHEALGHAELGTVKSSIDNGTVKVDKDERFLNSKDTCVYCAIAKASRCRHYRGSREKYMVETPFYLVHSDLLVLSFKSTKDGSVKGSAFRYIVTFICDYSKFNICFYLNDKTEVESAFRKYCAYIKNKFKADISYFHTDMGNEYKSNSMKDYYASNGITHITTNGYASMENGIAERFNRTLRDDMRTNLLESGIDNRFWPQVMEYTSMIRNKIIPKGKDKSPEQIIMEHCYPGTGRKEFIHHVFKSFGRYGIWLDASKKVSGLEMRAHHCFYLGPSEYPCSDKSPVLGGDKVLVFEKYKDGLYYPTIKDTRNVKYSTPVKVFKDISLENFGMKLGKSLNLEVDLIDKYGKAIPGKESEEMDIDYPVLPKNFVYEVNKSTLKNETPRDSDRGMLDSKDHMVPQEVQIRGADIPLNMGRDRVNVDVSKADEDTIPKAPELMNQVDSKIDNDDIGQTTDAMKQVVQQDKVEDKVDIPEPVKSQDEDTNNLGKDTNEVTQDGMVDEKEDAGEEPMDQVNIDGNISKEMSSITELDDRVDNVTSLGNEDSRSHDRIDDIAVEEITTEDLKRKETFERSMREDDIHKALELNENNLVEYEVDRTLLNTGNPHETIKLPEGRLLRSRFSMRSVNGIKIVANISKLPRDDPGPNRIIYQVVCHDPVEGPAWREAHRTEVEAHKERGTWNPKAIITSDPHILQRTVNMQTICTEKRPKELGGETKKKVRIVLRGDKQDKSTYDDTYSPTLPYDLLRLILAEAVQSNRHIEMIDISTAYLNADIDHEIYVQLPKHMEEKEYKLNHGEKVVHKVEKAIYGLKQSGYLWYNTLVKYLKSVGFEERGEIPCVLVKPQKKNKSKISIIVGFFVDDMIISGASKNEVDNFLFKLDKKFNLKMTLVNSQGFKDILGIHVRENRDKRSGTLLSIELSLEDYITNLVKNLDMKEEFDSQRHISTPMTPGFHFNLDEEEPMELSGEELAKEIHFFREVVGALQYIALTVRPDITYAANYLSRYCLCPHPKLKRELLRVVRYLYQTRKYMIRYTRYQSDLSQDMDRLITYSDADHAGDPVSRKSTLSAVFMMNGGPVAWFTRVAKFMATSSTDAEVAAMVESGNGLTHYREVLTFLGILGPEYSRRNEFYGAGYGRINEHKDDLKMEEFRRIRPLLVMVDNTAALYLAQKGKTSTKSKHMGIRVARARDIMENEHILYKYIGTKDMIADILTKPVTAEVMNSILPRMMVVDPPNVTHI